MRWNATLFCAVVLGTVGAKAASAQLVLPWVNSTAWGTPQALLFESEVEYSHPDWVGSWEESTSVGGSVGVSKFNSNLGTLLDVRVDVLGNTDYAWDITWEDMQGSLNYNFSATIGLIRAESPTLFVNPEYHWDNDYGDHGGLANSSDMGRLQAHFNETFHYSSTADLIDFTGPGIYTVNLLGDTTASGGWRFDQEASASGGMSGFYTGFMFVRYLFTPNPSASYINPTTGLPYEGDCNLDGFVGMADMNAILENWNLDGDVEGRELGYNEGDLDGDNFIGILDLNIVLGNWNAGTPPIAATIPEPAALSVLLCSGLLVLARQRR